MPLLHVVILLALIAVAVILAGIPWLYVLIALAVVLLVLILLYKR